MCVYLQLEETRGDDFKILQLLALRVQMNSFALIV